MFWLFVPRVDHSHKFNSENETHELKELLSYIIQFLENKEMIAELLLQLQNNPQIHSSLIKSNRQIRKNVPF